MAETVVILGSLNMDFVVQVPVLPAPGETTLGANFQTIPGGKGANQACAVGRLGDKLVHAEMIGRVGSDVFADQLKESLSAAGVGVDLVHATKTQPTGVALIWVDKNGQNSIVVAPGANSELKVEDVEQFRNTLNGARIALFQLETPLEVVEATLRIAAEQNVKTILDPAPAQPLARTLLENVDILTPNETEACLLLQRPVSPISQENAKAIAEQLLALGPKAIVLKLGEAGSYYWDGKSAVFVPGFKVKAVDSTAAGDVFNGALAIALAEGKEIDAALRFAGAAAAISVTRRGAQSSVPSRNEVDEFLRSRAS